MIECNSMSLETNAINTRARQDWATTFGNQLALWLNAAKHSQPLPCGHYYWAFFSMMKLVKIEENINVPTDFQNNII